jgi:predicted AAA+ superfamily ATPase
MLAHLHGGLLNYSSLGQSMGLSDQTIRRYIALLESTFMIRTLKPWHENINKRQIKTPKIYVRDSGILSCLLNIQGEDIFNHPKIGACWEGYVIEQIIAHHNASNNQAFFWASSNSAELDLLIVKGNQKHGVEIKYSDHPKITQSMHSAMESLGLEELTIIIPIENADYKLNESIHVMGLGTYLKTQLPI